MPTELTERVRLDRWLVAARLYKTRTIAQEHCAGGLVKLNAERADAGKMVKCGDTIEALRAERRLVWRVLALEVRRGNATAAQALYEDLTPVVPEVPVVEQRERGIGRPTKREGREIRWLKGYVEE